MQQMSVSPVRNQLEAAENAHMQEMVEVQKQSQMARNNSQESGVQSKHGMILSKSQR